MSKENPSLLEIAGFWFVAIIVINVTTSVLVVIPLIGIILFFLGHLMAIIVTIICIVGAFRAIFKNNSTDAVIDAIPDVSKRNEQHCESEGFKPNLRIESLKANHESESFKLTRKRVVLDGVAYIWEGTQWYAERSCLLADLNIRVKLAEQLEMGRAEEVKNVARSATTDEPQRSSHWTGGGNEPECDYGREKDDETDAEDGSPEGTGALDRDWDSDDETSAEDGSPY